MQLKTIKQMKEMNNVDLPSPFIYNDPVIPPVFAGRSNEMEFIYNALFSEKESIVIYGNDAIGKSSIVSTVYLSQIQNIKSGIFPVRINAFDFTQAVSSNFLGLTTHQICAAIWTTLLKRKYSELIEDSLINNQNAIFKRPEEVAIKRIFRIVTSENIKSTGKSSHDIGAKLIFEGNSSRSTELINERKPLAPFEFLHLLDELNDMIKSFGFNSIIVFCDELNHFPIETNTEILRNYFNIFSSKKIQFFLVALNPEIKSKDDAVKLIESFNHKLEIGPFTAISDVNELIQNSIKNSGTSIVFDRTIGEFLFAKTKGHPWWIQKICDNSFKTAIQKKIDFIDLKNIEESYNVFKNEIKIYEEKISFGLPFRKSYLRQ